MKKISLQLVAAITFFTRLPLWRVINIPGESFSGMICFWPLTGWLTSGVAALAWLGFSSILPTVPALVLTIATRTLFTGGLHEDGLGDFFDGFGGGKSKDDILRIMKDSHTGSYALIGMILYYFLLISTLATFPKDIIPYLILAADPAGKFLSGLMMNLLPYARTEKESKAKMLFEKMNVFRIFLATIFGLAPLLLLPQSKWMGAILLPIIIMLFMVLLSKRKINGYTGDISGATALFCELGFYLGITILYNYCL